MKEKIVEYHVSGYKGGNYFREIFTNEFVARDYAERFKAWANKDDFCHILKCETETLVLWKDI